MKRILCLYLYRLAIDRLRVTGIASPARAPAGAKGFQAEGIRTKEVRSGGGRSRGDQVAGRDSACGESSPGEPYRSPLVVVASSNGALRVVFADALARDRGVRPGHTLAEASALAWGLEVHHDDSRADRAALEGLAAWADCLSPVVHIEGDDTLLLDVTGCQRLFGGERGIVDRALAGLTARGFSAAVSMADTPGAAWALAHWLAAEDGLEAAGLEDRVSAAAFTGEGDFRSDAGGRFVIAPPGQTAASLARLPVWSLRVDGDAVAKLRIVGVQTVETLLHLPRASLARRFGEGLLNRLDQALGDAPEMLTPFRAAPTVRASVRFGVATDRLDLMREAVDRALEDFCRQLFRRMEGSRRVCVTFYCVDGLRPVGHRNCVLELSRATRDPAKLRALLEVKMEGLRLPGKVEALVVWSRRLEKLGDVQLSWLDAGPDDRKVLGELMDRLAVRLGSHAVVRPALVDDHQPELAFEYVRRHESGRNDGPEQGLPGRPLRLLQRPLEVSALSVVPDGPPLRFRFQGADHRVASWAGPERIETGWWRRRPVRRDYYRVENNTGCHYWIFRERSAGKWFVHGVFD